MTLNGDNYRANVSAYGAGDVSVEATSNNVTFAGDLTVNTDDGVATGNVYLKASSEHTLQVNGDTTLYANVDANLNGDTSGADATGSPFCSRSALALSIGMRATPACWSTQP